jgi:hypothetical protein
MSIPKKFFSLLVAAVAIGASSARAASLDWFSNDTRPNGSVSVDSFSNLGSNSLKFTTTSPGGNTSNSKASVIFHSTPAGPLGTLGDLNQFDIEFYLDGANTTPSNSGFAVRLLTNAVGTQALVWEGAYNSPNVSETKGQWVATSLMNQNYWQRANGQNFDTGGNWQPLDQWEAGFTPAGGATLNANTPIYGVQVSFGSGIAGDFTGYLDQLVIGFGGASPIVYTASIPEPATIAMAGFAAIAGLTVCRKQRKA